MKYRAVPVPAGHYRIEKWQEYTLLFFFTFSRWEYETVAMTETDVKNIMKHLEKPIVYSGELI